MLSKISKKARGLYSRHFERKIDFTRLAERSSICLYAGDVPGTGRYQKFVGLSINQANWQHIKHDILQPIPLRDGCVDIFQSEDVFEHIERDRIPAILNEIYRLLKPGGIMRMSVPDYRCDLLRDRTVKDSDGNPIFDPGGGGEYINGRVVNGGHLWFPVYESVKSIVSMSRFEDVCFYHYYDEKGKPVTRRIDYSVGYVQRTPDHDPRVQDPYRPLSIVLDCRKSFD